MEVETTPLLSNTDNNPDNDKIDVLPFNLDKEQQEAILNDSKLSSMDIIKEEGAILLEFAILVILGQTVEMLPDTMLSILAGNVSATQSTEILAAYSLSSLYRVIFVFVVLLGISSASDTLCSQSFGGKQYVEFWYYAQSTLLLLAICLPMQMGAMFSGSMILDLLGQDPNISLMAGNILLITSISTPFYSLAGIMRSVLQAQNIALPFFYASLLAWPISLAMSYICGYYTSMGYLGIAVGVPVQYFIKCLILAPYIWKNDVYQQYWPGWSLSHAWALLPRVTKLGLSGILMSFFLVMGFATVTLLAGLLPNPSAVMSANSIFQSVSDICTLPLIGISIAGGIRIGNALGAGRGRRASLIFQTVIGATMTTGIVIVASVPLFAKSYLSLFTSNKESLSIALGLVHSVRILFLVFGIQIGFFALLRACGMQLFSALLNFISYVVVGTPIGLYLAITVQLDLVGLWAGNIIGCVVGILIAAAWYSRVNWHDLIADAQENTHYKQRGRTSSGSHP